MSSPIVTGSGGDRFMNCLASSVLPRVFDEVAVRVRDGKLVPVDDATRGTEVHAHLERIAEGVDEETSLDLVDERFREAAAEIDLRAIADLTALAPEVAIAYCPETDTARVLGRALDRDYDGAGIRSNEVPMTIDVVGVGPARTFNGDYKTGWGRILPVSQNWQLRLGALATARAFERDEDEGQLIFLREGKPVKRDRHVFDAAELAATAFETEQQWETVLAAREDFREHDIVPEAKRGSWCKYCPSRHVCPAQHALIQALGAHAEPGPEAIAKKISLMPVSEVGAAFRKIKELKVAMDAFETAIYQRAAYEPILISTEDDGSELWLGEADKMGNRELDPDRTAEVLREFFPDDETIVDDVMERAVTIKRLESAVKLRVAKGQGAARIRRVMTAIDKAGGLHRPMRTSVHVYRLAPEKISGAPQSEARSRQLDGTTAEPHLRLVASDAVEVPEP